MNVIIEKLSELVDWFASLWARATKGRRGADDYSGFLWIAGLVILVIDIFARSVFWLVLSLLLIAYGFFRCFSTWESFHDGENRGFHKCLEGLKKFFRLSGVRVKDNVKKVKDADKKEAIKKARDAVMPDPEKREERKQRKLEEERKKREAREILERRESERRVEAAMAAREQQKASAQLEKERIEKERERVAAINRAARTGQTADLSGLKPQADVTSDVVPSSEEARTEDSSKKSGVQPSVNLESTVNSPSRPDQGTETVREQAPASRQDTQSSEPEEKPAQQKYYIFECPGCGQKVRIPDRGKKGKVAIVCPSCHTRFVKDRV